MIPFLISAFINQSQPNLSYLNNAVAIEQQIKEENKEVDLIYPLKQKYPVSSPYGMRRGRKHRGVDIALPIGTPIISPIKGRVIVAGYDSYKNWVGYGNVVVVENDSYRVLLAHLNKIAVRVGNDLEQGQYLGDSGNSGNSSGPHTHIEILIKSKNGEWVHIDPASKINFDY